MICHHFLNHAKNVEKESNVHDKDLHWSNLQYLQKVLIKMMMSSFTTSCKDTWICSIFSKPTVGRNCTFFGFILRKIIQLAASFPPQHVQRWVIVDLNFWTCKRINRQIKCHYNWSSKKNSHLGWGPIVVLGLTIFTWISQPTTISKTNIWEFHLVCATGRQIFWTLIESWFNLTRNEIPTCKTSRTGNHREIIFHFEVLVRSQTT